MTSGLLIGVVVASFQAQLVSKPIALQSGDGSRFEAEECRLTVPESRAHPTKTTIELAFVRVKSKAAHPLAPTVFLQGGPGQPATPIAHDPDELAQWSELLAQGDVIFLDQRGVGASTPSLAFAPENPLDVPYEFFADLALARRLIVDGNQECFDHFEALGVDLAAYNTEESADDVDDLRAALKVERINVVGFSYGTLLGLTLLRRHGAHVDHAVLVGTEGPRDWGSLPATIEAQIGKLSWLAAHDEGVNHAVPDLRALLERVLKKLEEHPLEVTIEDRAAGKKVQLLLGRWGLEFLLRIDVGDGNDFPLFPALLWSIDQGRTDLITPILAKRYQQLRGGSSAMAQAVRFAYGPTPAFERELADQEGACAFRHMVNYFDLDCRPVWEVPLHAAAFRSELVTDVPTLFVSGTLDSNAPPYQAERVRTGFLRSTHLVVEYAGHEDLLPNPEIRRVIATFLRGEAVGDRRVAIRRAAR